MQSKQLDTGEHDKTHILVFDIGDEAMGGLLEFAREHNITSAHFTAIGAFSDATLAWFNWQTKEYRTIPIREQVEVLTLAGDIAVKDGYPKVHAHVVLGQWDGSAHGGHLMEAHVRPTLEVALTETCPVITRSSPGTARLPRASAMCSSTAVMAHTSSA